MRKKRYASFDIGTNTILMLIADCGKDLKLERIDEAYHVARLGENLDKTGIITEEAIQRASEILVNLKKSCDDYKVENILPVATSAMRDAKNGPEIKQRFDKILQADLKIISGEQEAALSFAGAVDNSRTSVVIDIGGGSTEIIFGRNLAVEYAKSLQIGAVRLTEKFFTAQPPNEIELNDSYDYIINNLKTLPFTYFPAGTNFYGVAGTATTVATTALGYDDSEVNKVDGYIATIDKIREIFKLYSESTTEEIISKYRVHPRRADLITSGTQILLAIMEYFGIESLKISSKGLRYGVIIDHLKNC